MRIEGNAIIAFLIGDSSADRIVPKIGLTAWLVVFTSMAMAFLAVFALALMLTTERISQSWADELTKSATVRVNAPKGQIATKTAAAVRVLQTTPGILATRVLSDDDQRALLEPWIGADVPFDRLPIPRLIEISVDQEVFDPENLALRLEGEVPGARLDDHARWRAPLIDAAKRVRLMGIGAVALIGGVMAAMITLAARAALSSNAQVIEVLRLIGARDVYVARAFVRRLTLRAIGGALLGSILGVICVALLPPADQGTGLLAGFGFQGAEWLWPGLLPFATGVVAFWSTRTAALSALKRNK